MKQKIYFFALFSFFSCLVQTVFASCTSDIKESVAPEAAFSGPVITVDSVTNVNCNGANTGAIYISVSGGVTPYYYLWSMGDTSEDISGLYAGTYTLTVTDGASATATANVTVTQPAICQPNIPMASISCFGVTTNICATIICGTPPYSYQWGNGATTSCISITAGFYNVTVTDVNGCSSQVSTTITQPTALTATSTQGAPILCNGGITNVTISCSGGTSPYSGVGTFTVNAGVHAYTVTDANGCTANTNITVSQPCPVAPNVSSPSILCYGGTTNICGAAVCGTLPYSYQWSNGYTGSCISNIIAGVWGVSVTDGNGCVAQTVVTITEPPPFSISTSVINATCGGCNNGSATVSGAGGTPPYSIWWSNSQITFTATNLSAGAYSVCVTDANACSLCDSVILGVGTCSAAFTLIPDTAILHHYFAVNTSTGVAPLTYLWSWGDGTTDTAAYPNHTYASAGNYSICLTITDAVACTNSYCYSSYLHHPNSTMISITVVPSLITWVINESNFYQTLKLFPNPTNGSVAISYSLPKSSDVIIEVYNSYGQLVKEITNEKQSSGRQETVFDSQKLAAGIYFVKVTVDGNATVLKMAKM